MMLDSDIPETKQQHPEHKDAHYMAGAESLDFVTFCPREPTLRSLVPQQIGWRRLYYVY